MSFSQFYVISPRGDSIVSKDWRGDLPRSTSDVFFRNVKFWDGKQQDAPPIFHIDGINYVYMKKNGLYFVFTNKVNVSAAQAVELLDRITKVFKDYCGTLTEESIRANFVLLYELLDEMLDFGFVQGTSSDLLKSFVFNQPVVLKTAVPEARAARQTMAAAAVDRSIIAQSNQRRNGKNEIFVDVFERVSITFNANGHILNSSIDGTVQMKSFLSGNPGLRVALNEEIVVGKSSAGGYGVIHLDDCNFHEVCRLDEWENQRVISFVPPEGEFVVMNYRITSDFRVPFRIFPFFELTTPYKVELIVKVRADIPENSYGHGVVVEIPMPKSTASVSCDVGLGVVGQTTEFNSKERKVYWRIKKFDGGTEHTLRTKITLSTAHQNTVRKEIGPISMKFEIPMYNASKLLIRYLRVIEDQNYNPSRWVRYMTKSSSYICRI